jgi:transcription antitermination factor NusG
MTWFMPWFMNISVYYSHKLHDGFFWFMKFDTFFFLDQGEDHWNIVENHPLVMGIIRSSLRSPYVISRFSLLSPRMMCKSQEKADGLIYFNMNQVWDSEPPS